MGEKITRRAHCGGSGGSHAESVREHVSRYATVNWLDTFEFRSAWKLVFETTEGRFSGRLVNQGSSIDVPALSGIFYRGGESSPLPLDFDPKADAVDQSEHEDALLGLLCLASTANWINNPITQRRLLLKANQLVVASRHGLAVPDTVITNSPQIAREFLEAHDEVICKLLSHEFYGTAPEDELAVYTSVVDAATFAEYADDIALCPTLLQRRVPKIADIRVNVIGDVVYAAEIRSQEREESKVDFRLVGNLNQLRTLPHVLPPAIQSACVNMLKTHGLLFGAFDFALTPEGQYVFFEVNLTGNWLWLEHMIGLPISSAIADALTKDTRQIMAMM